jgi:FdhD protein
MDESKQSGSSRAFLTERFDAEKSARLAMDELSAEEPLEIRVRFHRGAHQVERVVSITMRTPGRERELALGFLVTEGVLPDLRSVESIALDPDEPNRVIIALSQPIELDRLQRNFYTTSSCGICGKASLAAVAMHRPVQLPTHRPAIPVELLYSLPERLAQAQPTFRLTGGLHGAALFSVAGDVIGACEDVGRHNAVDKLIGLQLLQGQPDFSEFVLALSGRAGFELVQKSLMAGIPAVVAVGAPSSLAVELARAYDQTLVGFLRERRFNVYSGRDRIVGGRDGNETARRQNGETATGR